MNVRHPARYIIFGLLDGWAWFDDALQQIIGSDLTTSQSVLVMRVAEGYTRQTDIARRMRLSKQAVRNIASDLIDMGILTLIDDPGDGRSKMLVFTAKGVQLARSARQALIGLEDVLIGLVGTKDFQAFRRVLETDWGAAPTSRKTLPHKHVGTAPRPLPLPTKRKQTLPSRKRKS